MGISQYDPAAAGDQLGMRVGRSAPNVLSKSDRSGRSASILIGKADFAIEPCSTSRSIASFEAVTW